MAKLKRKRLLAAKVESTAGTAETLTASEAAFNVYDPMIQATIEVEPRESQGSLDNLSGVPGARTGTCTFRTDTWWDGSTTMPSWASVFLPACGWVETSQVYNPTSETPGSNVKTLTIAVYEDGVIKKLTGAMGTFRIVCPAGRMVFVEWTFTGVWNAPVDGALLAPTYPTDLPIRYANATSTYDSVALCVENVTFDAGNNVILKECPSTASGFDYAVVTSRTPTITANPEATLIATDDPYGSWLSADEAVFTVTLDGPSDSTIEISADKAQITNVQEADRNGIVTDDVTFSCNKNGATADQALQITFSEAS